MTPIKVRIEKKVIKLNIKARGPSGIDGETMMLRNNGTHVQWKYTTQTDEEWQNLESLANLKGDSIELSVDETNIYWKYTTDAEWQILIPLASLTGEKGDAGDQGEPGQSVELINEEGNISWRLVGDTEWQLLIPVESLIGPQGEQGLQGDPGPQGDPGLDGAPIELWVDDPYIKWRVSGHEDWIELIELSTLTGAPGQSVELAVNDGVVQWRYVNPEGEWTTLVSIDELTGAPGTPGEPGIYFQGAWNLEAGGYGLADVVTHNGSTYYCILTHGPNSADYEPGVGSEWGTYWTVMAEKGEVGGEGPTGLTGPQGDVGGASRIGVNTANWSMPGWSIDTTTTRTFGTLTGMTLFVPIYLGGDQTFDKIGLNVTSGGHADNPVRLGIYNSKVVDGVLLPSTVNLDAGYCAVNATGDLSIDIDKTLTKGYYFLAISITTGSVTALTVTVISTTLTMPVNGITISTGIGATNCMIYTIQGGGHTALYSGFTDDPSVSTTIRLKTYGCVFLRNKVV